MAIDTEIRMIEEAASRMARRLGLVYVSLPAKKQAFIDAISKHGAR